MISRFFMIVGLALGLISTPALAAPKITEKVEYYYVNSTTTRGLVTEMTAKEPKGYWAKTRWFIEWSSSCNVAVTITYILPRHQKPNSMPADVRAKFDRMFANLVDHERLHALHGVKAGVEIDRAGCRNAQSIIKKYNKADIELDRRTNHGRNDGVTLN